MQHDPRGAHVYSVCSQACHDPNGVTCLYSVCSQASHDPNGVTCFHHKYSIDPIKQIFIFELNFIFPQKLDVFIFEGFLFMMFFLVLYICNHTM